MVYGPTKKKIVEPKNSKKKMNMPIVYKDSKQLPEFFFLLIVFIALDIPAIPSNRKTIEDIYKPIRTPLIIPSLARSIISFFSTFMYMVTK
jgi:hypothetical protein